MDKNAITIALPKGRLLKDCIDLLASIGITSVEDISTTRRLLVPSKDGTVRFLIIRDKDLPTYIDYGAADMGVAGKDILAESSRNILEPVDLGFGSCRIVVARPEAYNRESNHAGWGLSRIATKYPNITRSYFATRGEQVDIVPLYGSIELAPLVGLADRIVDLVSTGQTLRQNSLEEIDVVMAVTARLVVNPASMKLKADRIVPIVEAMREKIMKRRSGEPCTCQIR